MKKLQALYNDDANKIVEEAAQEKDVKENLNVLINFATIAKVAEDTKPMKDESRTFNKAWNHPNPES